VIKRIVFILLLMIALPVLAAETLPSMLARANALAARKDFAAAERAAAEAVQRYPASRDARLALADILLWEGRYDEARERFAELLTRNPSDGDARLGIAHAEYWSGDYRTALRDFRVVSERPEAQRAIREIGAASAPGYAVGAVLLSDDQPYRAASGTISVFAFSDPLTKWQIDIDDSHRTSGGRDVTTPAVRAGVETTIVPLHATVRASLGRMRFPDDTTTALPALAAMFKLSDTALTVSASREPLLRTVASLGAHPNADVLSLRWSRDDRFAVHAEQLRYFDGNRGNAVDAFMLHPLGAFSFGASAAWRNTSESRFVGGVYDPYYTPRGLREGRAVASWKMRHGRADVGIHVDAGVGRDDIAGSFHPWRVMLNFTSPIADRATLAIAAERNATAFYTSNEIRASLAGRF
jgi:tetratricopeptide (TPR) repeat protein